MQELTPTAYGVEFEAKVLDSQPLTPTSHHLRVTRPPGFSFDPVQFTYLSIKTPEAPDYSDYRPMSLASSPTRDHLAYGAKITGSAYKQAFQALEPGDRVLVEGPVGDFILDESRPAVFLAGGIGITPIKGMLEYVADRRVDLPCLLLYSARTPAELAYRRELDELAMARSTIESVYTITRPEESDEPWEGRVGRIDARLLEPVTGERRWRRARYYVCGTPGMVEDMTDLLAELGIPETRIVHEGFWGYQDRDT
ncbi:MAG: FAD-dependent oxidoreductase [Candidatus Thermoplasmatota archaeon]|nr:FAD-dependent oxidoreductase [Candidatus Thermoplasmatota archaeon]